LDSEFADSYRIFGAFGDPTHRAIVARLTAMRNGRTLVMLRHQRLIKLER
jgi:hypothetical protein